LANGETQIIFGWADETARGGGLSVRAHDESSGDGEKECKFADHFARKRWEKRVGTAVPRAKKQATLSTAGLKNYVVSIIVELATRGIVCNWIGNECMPSLA
jgi:hypothetical protein